MNILITGGTGYFGNAFVDHLLSNDLSDRICVYSRDEFKQAQMRDHFKNDPRLRFFVGDVRDQQRLERAFTGIDVVVHAAALKRIETGAYNPDEMTKTNIGGAINVIEASRKANIDRVVFLSTDKAYQPISPYGQSKALAESLFLTANDMSYGPKFSVTRYGNVIGSTGSVVPRWRAMKASGIKKVPVTDPECTRFWMFKHEAVDLVLHTMNFNPTKLVIPTLPAFTIGDLAKAMNLKTDIIGLPKWEKKHESMADGNSSDTARRMSVNEIREKLNHV